MVWVMKSDSTLVWQDEAGASEALESGVEANVLDAFLPVDGAASEWGWQGLDLFPADQGLVDPLDMTGRLDTAISVDTPPTDLFPVVNLLPWGETVVPDAGGQVQITTGEGLTVVAPGFTLIDLLATPT